MPFTQISQMLKIYLICYHSFSPSFPLLSLFLSLNIQLFQSKLMWQYAHLSLNTTEYVS